MYGIYFSLLLFCGTYKRFDAWCVFWFDAIWINVYVISCPWIWYLTSIYITTYRASTVGGSRWPQKRTELRRSVSLLLSTIWSYLVTLVILYSYRTASSSWDVSIMWASIGVSMESCVLARFWQLMEGIFSSVARLQRDSSKHLTTSRHVRIHQ